MKKLGKLSINLNKVIKNEELVNLRGGYGGYGGYSPEVGSGKCGFTTHDGQLGACGVSKEAAQYLANYYHGRWCCDTPTEYCNTCGS